MGGLYVGRDSLNLGAGDALTEKVSPLHETNLEAEFFNWSILEVLGTEDPDSLRGEGVSGVVPDEYADMREEAWPA